MNANRIKEHTVDFLFTVSLFFVFAASALAVVLLSLQSYQGVTSQSEANYNLRTGSSYISQKIKHSDKAGGISVETIDGISVLSLSQEFNEKPYVTYIYSLDGSLMELFSPKDANLSLQSGVEILPMNEFTAQEISKGLYTFTFTTPDGGKHQLDIATRA